MRNEYKNKVAIVTGGASGIGRGLAEVLAEQGCEVVLADLQDELAREVANSIKDSGGKASAVKLDVTDYEAVEKLVKETKERTGRLDFMFNNAGIGTGGETHLYSIDDWNRIIDVNLRGVVNGVHAAYLVMREQGSGHIVNTSSMAGLMPTPIVVGYSMAKHGVVGLSIGLRPEAASRGVRVSVICPGVIRTPILYDGGKYGKLISEKKIPGEKMEKEFERLKPMEPRVFARKVLKKVARNKAIIVVPAWWKIFWWLNRFSPSLGLWLAGKSYQDNQKKMNKQENKQD